MREIKFRAWDGEIMMDVANKVDIHEDEKIMDWDILFDPKREVVVMQYTGIKDKNDVEIYEGDILFRVKPKMFRGIPTVNEYAIVEYKHDCFVGRYSDQEEFSGQTGISYFLTTPTPFEVIGNIYQSKHLLDNIDTKV